MVLERPHILTVIPTREAMSLVKDTEQEPIDLKVLGNMSENTPKERNTVKARFGIQVRSDYLVLYTHDMY